MSKHLEQQLFKYKRELNFYIRENNYNKSQAQFASYAAIAFGIIDLLLIIVLTIIV